MTGVGQREVIDLTRLEGAEDSARDPFERVAIALGSTLEFREVLRRLADAGRGVMGAGRCSVFLLEDRGLYPAVAIGDRPDDSLWEAFRNMGPITLDDRGWEMLQRGKAVGVGDVGQSDLVPDHWIDRFDVGAVALAPLVVDGRPAGLVAVDWPQPRRIGDEELALLSAIAGFAGVAVRNARLFEGATRRERLHGTLITAAAALGSALDRREVAEHLTEAFAGLLEPRLCGAGLFDPDRSSLIDVVMRGSTPPSARIHMEEIPPHIVERVRSEWARAKAPLEFGDEPWFGEALDGWSAGAAWYLLLPIVVEGHSRALVLIGFEAGRSLHDDERSAATALAAMGSTALERCVLVERQDRRLRQMNVLYRTSAALTERTDAKVLVDELGALLESHGVLVKGAAFADQRLVERLGGEPVTAEETAAWEAGAPWPELADGSLSVPMSLGGRLVGALRVKAPVLDGEERSFLEVLARDLAEVASRSVLRAELEEAARDRAIAEERERMASDLHDTAGQVLITMGLLARDHLGRLEPDSQHRELLARLAALAERGKHEIDDAARALAFMPAARRGLIPSLRSLVEAVQADSGLSISLEADSTTTRLEPEIERALFRVAHEAVANAWRHSACTQIDVEMWFERGEAVLSVEDDGLGTGAEAPPEGVGIGGMRRAIEAVGGSVRVGNRPEGGFRVDARAPRREVDW